MPAVFTPTPAEASLVNQIFLHADPQKSGMVTGDAAVKVFDGAKLPSTVLGEIWTLADDDNNGWLSTKGVAAAVRLMGWAQKGEPISAALLQKPGPLPKLEGINTVGQQSTGMSLPRSPLPYFPPLTPQDKEKFNGIFVKNGPTNGLLSGEKARDIFLKSRLPNEQLIQIWNLADTQDRGNLDATDFAIGMYFIQGLMSKKISFVPTSLPPGLYQQAGGGSGVATHMTGNSGSFSPTAGSQFNVQPQYTGQSRLQLNHTGMSSQARSPALPPRPYVPSIAARSLSPPAQAPQAVVHWDVTPTEKATSDQWFHDLDKESRGYIEGGVAVPFMLQSGLPGEILANVWDLADLNNDGLLTREGFAVAMHLIQKKLAGGEIPSKLPNTLIPPSLRPAPPVEPQKDLFSFDDSPPPSAIQSQGTGEFATLQPQRTGPLSYMTPQQTGTRAVSMAHDPFASSVSPNYTGSPQNFLDDDEPVTTSTSLPLQDQSAEIGNVKNQFSSTNASLEKTRSEREALEQSLAAQASQLSALQTQLSAAKASYETELKLYGTLEERHKIQQAEMDKVRQELISAESNLSAKRVEKAEIEGSFLRDKEDHRELNRRMVETSQQIEGVKVEIEKLKKEAKQQKGLLAIAKKQLATKVAERAKYEQELQEANEELEFDIKEAEEMESAIANIEMPVPKAATPGLVRSDTLSFAAAQPLPTTPDPVASPSTASKSNNPFERLAMGGSASRSQSPFTPFPNAGLNKALDADSPLEDDFFGFAQQSKQSENGGSAEGLPYDKQEEAVDLNNGLAVAANDRTPVSPNETELFHTPPTSARPLSPVASVGAVASKFPAIDSITSQIASQDPTSSKATNGDNFDDVFGSRVQDLEVDETDSDSDSDDEVPLAILSQGAPQQKSARKEKETVQPAVTEAQSFDDVFASSTIDIKSSDATPAPSGTDVFTDIFNPSPSASSASPPTAEVATTDGHPISSKPDALPSIQPTPTVAGVDAFDEALGIVPTSTGTAAPAFSFESAFEDNFDFGAASTAFPLPVASQPMQQTAAPATTNFDDIFAAAPVNGHSAEPTNSTPQTQVEAKPVEATKTEVPSTTFDEAFGSSFTDPIPVTSSPAPVVSPPTQDTPSIASTPFPLSSSPTTSPKQSLSKQRPSSPLVARAASPPPRAPSPKPRVSSSSSKDGQEKPAVPPPRHSKLSIRLPFGKKKKQQQQQHEPMPPSSHLAPHKEQPERAVTPATEDDVEAVKQLTDMGFSRGQAVEALEKYGYNVNRALNSLLGTA